MFVLVSSISIPSSYTDLLAVFLIWIHKINSLLSFSISLRLVLPGVHYMLIKETGGRENFSAFIAAFILLHAEP